MKVWGCGENEATWLFAGLSGVELRSIKEMMISRKQGDVWYEDIIEDTLFDGINLLARRGRLLSLAVSSSLKHLTNLSLSWTTSRVVLFNMEKSLRDFLGKNIDKSNLENIDAAPAFDENETKAILRKVDWRLLPMLTLLYVLSFIDRSNSEFRLSV